MRLGIFDSIWLPAHIISVLNFEFWSLCIICYLVFGAWNFLH